MKTTIANGVLTIEMPLDPNPQRSKSGKSLMLFTTSGFVKVGGAEDVSVSINVIKKIK